MQRSPSPHVLLRKCGRIRADTLDELVEDVRANVHRELKIYDPDDLCAATSS